MTRAKFSLVAAVLSVLPMVQSAQALDMKTNAVPSIAVHDEKLHVIFSEHGDSYLRDGQYDLATGRWISAERIGDGNARPTWARSPQAPVVVANVHKGMTETTRWMDLVYNGLDYGTLWFSALRQGTAPYARRWETMRAMAELPDAGRLIENTPLGAARHRWRGGLGLSAAVAPRLTVAYLREDHRVHMRVLVDEAGNRWSEERTLPGPRISENGRTSGIALLSSRAGGHIVSGTRAAALYAFWADSGSAGVEGGRIYYRRLHNPNFAVGEWGPIQFLPPSLPQASYPVIMTYTPDDRPIFTRPGPIGVAEHPWGLLVGYLGGTGAESAPTGRIHLAFSTDGDTDDWVSLGRDNAPVSNMIDSVSNPALTVHGGQIYVAYIPRNITPGDWFDHELCVGIIDPFASGGPEFRSLRTDLPMTEDGRRYCETE